MKNLVFTFCLAASVLVSAIAQAQSDGFSRIFVFGDSLSDTGRSFAQSQDMFPPSPPYRNGRFSNDKLWIERLASSLNIRYSSQDNFSFGGAFSGTGAIPDPSAPVGVRQQVNRFVNGLGGRSADRRALYVVWGGANDYLAFYLDSFSSDSTPQSVTDNIVTSVRRLARNGAREFLIPNMPNLSRVPLVNRLDPGIREGARNDLLGVSRGHNILLRNKLNELREELRDKQNIRIKLNIVNVFSLTNSIVSNPQRFGFSNNRAACFFLFTGQKPPCDNPNSRVFFDEIHPSGRTHRLIANRALNVLMD